MTVQCHKLIYSAYSRIQVAVNLGKQSIVAVLVDCRDAAHGTKAVFDKAVKAVDSVGITVVEQVVSNDTTWQQLGVPSASESIGRSFMKAPCTTTDETHPKSAPMDYTGDGGRQVDIYLVLKRP